LLRAARKEASCGAAPGAEFTNPTLLLSLSPVFRLQGGQRTAAATGHGRYARASRVARPW